MSAEMAKKKTYRILLIVIILFTSIVYGNVVMNDYNLDDDFVIYKNELVHQGISAIPEIFLTNYSTGQGRTYGYRPIVKSMFAVEYELFGENPHLSHFINLLLYILTGLMIFYLLVRIFKDQNIYVLFLITLLFIAHPLHTEVVASLKNREELMSFLFGLFALHFSLNYIDKRKWFFIPFALICFTIAYLSKESVLVFAAIIPLTLYNYSSEKIWKLLLYMGMFLVIYKLISSSIDWFLPSDKQMQYYENPMYFHHDFITKWVIGMQSLYKYLYLQFIPFPLIFYYGFNQIPFTEWYDYRIIIAFLIYTAIFIVALKQLRKKTMLSYGILFFLISISMFSNLYVPVSGIVGERLAYFSSLGFCIALVAVFIRVQKQKKRQKVPVISGIILGIIIIIFSVYSIKRNSQWKDYMTLLSHDIKYANRSARANSLYAGYLLSEIQTSKTLTNAQKRNYLQLSERYFQKSLTIYPDYFMALKNLGNIYYVYYKDFDKAESYYEKALKIDSLNSDIYLNLGYILESNKKYKEAESLYNKALMIDSLNIQSWSLMANLQYKKGNLEQAMQINHQIEKMDSTIDLPYINIGNYYLMEQDTVKAVGYWEKAIEKNQNNPQLLYGLYRFFSQTGNQKKSNYYSTIYQKVNEKAGQK